MQYSLPPLGVPLLSLLLSFPAHAPVRAAAPRRVWWLSPVIQATGRLRLEDCLSSGALSCSGLCWAGVHTKFSIDMVILGEPRTTRSSKEGWTGPGRKRSRSNPPYCPVVGSPLWIDAVVQPEQHSETQSFYTHHYNTATPTVTLEQNTAALFIILASQFIKNLQTAAVTFVQHRLLLEDSWYYIKLWWPALHSDDKNISVK